MKSSNSIVTIIVIGAVLVAAYAVGLLIRQARVGDSSSSSSSATEVNESRLRDEAAKASHEPGTGGTKDTQEARAKLKEERAKTLEKMASATEQEKAQIRERVRERVTPRPGQKAVRRLAPKPTDVAAVPAVQDPNASRSPEKTDSEPNQTGQG